MMFNRAFGKIREGAGTVAGKVRAPRERGRLARMLSLADSNAPVSGLAPKGRCCRRLGGCLESRAGAREVILQIKFSRPGNADLAPGDVVENLE